MDLRLNKWIDHDDCVWKTYGNSDVGEVVCGDWVPRWSCFVRGTRSITEGYSAAMVGRSIVFTLADSETGWMLKSQVGGP
jgi:hypothetical protein